MASTTKWVKIVKHTTPLYTGAFIGIVRSKYPELIPNALELFNRNRCTFAVVSSPRVCDRCVIVDEFMLNEQNVLVLRDRNSPRLFFVLNDDCIEHETLKSMKEVSRISVPEVAAEVDRYIHIGDLRKIGSCWMGYISGPHVVRFYVELTSKRPFDYNDPEMATSSNTFEIVSRLIQRFVKRAPYIVNCFVGQIEAEDLVFDVLDGNTVRVYFTPLEHTNDQYMKFIDDVNVLTK